jgi:integrase
VPVLYLTDLAIQRLPSSQRHDTYWDASLPSFGIRVGKRSRTFVMMRGAERRRITLGRYPFTSLKEARLKAHALIAGTHTIDEKDDSPKAILIVDQFLEAHRQKTRENTHREAKRILHKHFLPVFAEIPLTAVTTKELTRLIDGLLTTPSEAIKTHAVVSAFMNWAQRRQFITRNPLAGMPLPARPVSRDRVLTDTELAAILKAALRIISTPYGALIMILAHTGLRKTEAHTLRRSNITRDTITIPKEIAKYHTELVLPNTINGYLASIPNTGDRLFPDKIDWQAAKRQFDDRCGVRDWILHDFRRTLSTKMAEWEIAPPDVVEAILNHKSGSRSQIQRVYDRHSRLPQMRRALGAYADRLAAMIAAH